MGVMDGGGLRPEQARLRLAVGLGANFSREDLQLYLLGKK
jgi:L-asparaginase